MGRAEFKYCRKDGEGLGGGTIRRENSKGTLSCPDEVLR